MSASIAMSKSIAMSELIGSLLAPGPQCDDSPTFYKMPQAGGSALLAARQQGRESCRAVDFTSHQKVLKRAPQDPAAQGHWPATQMMVAPTASTSCVHLESTTCATESTWDRQHAPLLQQQLACKPECCLAAIAPHHRRAAGR
jgi:hypothetical protein